MSNRIDPNPWLNQPLALWDGDPRASMLLDWVAGKIDAEAIERWAAAAPVRRSPGGSHGLGVIALQGIIMRRPGPIETLLGATSLDGFMARFRALAADPDISTILMAIDSPGGEVYGVPEAAAEIRATRAQKRVIALAYDTAASAAYWLGSQADELIVSPSGGVGAIEVYRVHMDITGALEQAGIKREVIAGGPNQRHGASGMPLDEAQRADFQAQADELYAMYAGDVAAGRGVSVADVTSGYGQGRFLMAKQAKAAGMIDRIDTLEGTIRRLTSRGQAMRGQEVLVGEHGPELFVPIADVPPSAAARFAERVAAVATEALQVAGQATERARLRAKEGRPAFSPSTERSLRSIRAAIDDLLEPDDPAPSAPPKEPDEPEPSTSITRRSTTTAWQDFRRADLEAPIGVI